MARQRRGATARWMGCAVAVLLVSGCAPTEPPGPSPEPPVTVDTTTPSSPSTSVNPEPSPSPSPSPSSTLSEDQTAATETVLEFFRLKNELGQDPYLEFQPLANITTGQTQVLQMSVIDRYRVEELVQQGETLYYILSVGSISATQEGMSVFVNACTDATDVDLVDITTGSSVLPADREFFVEWNMEVLHDGFSWKVGDITSATVDRCGP